MVKHMIIWKFKDEVTDKTAQGLAIKNALETRAFFAFCPKITCQNQNFAVLQELALVLGGRRESRDARMQAALRICHAEFLQGSLSA